MAVAFADEEAAEAPAAVLPALTYGHLPYAYHYGAPLTYTVPAPVQYKYVPKEVEIEVKTFQPEVTTTGCVNVFGTPVPCRAKRDADEAAEAEEAAPAAATLPYYYAPGYYGAPLAYAHHAAPLAYAHHLAVSFTHFYS